MTLRKMQVLSGTGEKIGSVWSQVKSSAMVSLQESLTNLRRESMNLDKKETNVLLKSETGVFTNEVAKRIHGFSRKSKDTFVQVLCSDPDSVAAWESQGQDSGTLVLQGVDALSKDKQASLFNFICKSTTVRVIASTTQNIDEAVNGGRFNSELFKMISQSSISVPSFRERGEDRVTVAKEYATTIYRKFGKQFPGFSVEAVSAISDYNWPGNDAEVVSCLKRTCLTTKGDSPVSVDELGVEHASSPSIFNGKPRLELVPSPYQAPTDATGGDEGYMSFKRRWSESFERGYLIASLTRHNGNVSASAREAKVDRSNFLRLLRRHAIKAHEYRQAGSVVPIGIESDESDSGEETAA